MGTKKGWSLSQDLDIFGDLGDTDWVTADSNELFGVDEASSEVSADELLWDVKEEPKKEEPKKEEEVVAEPKSEDKPAEDETKEDKKDTVETSDDDDAEFKKLVDEILSASTEVDDKVEELKQQAKDDGNKDMIDMIDSLQSMLAEKNLQIEELTKKNEVVNSKYLDRYADSEWLMMHKDVIDKLEDDPKLMMLVKYSDSDNAKIKDRVLNILTDMIYKQTWQDVRELLDTAQKDSVTAILWTPDSQMSLETPKPQKEDKDKTFEESIQDLF